MRESDADIRITFGMIVLNGEPFIKYNLRSLYPFAHQIIVVEGANINSAHCATANGHSVDESMKSLKEFKKSEDPENKVVIVTAEDEGHSNGFWAGEKDEQSQAYSKRATGNYLWQVDSDEFYHEEQLGRLMKILRTKRPDTVTFPMITFWGSPDYIVDSFYLTTQKQNHYHRLFAWRPGYTYATHRPPTVLDEQGTDLRKKYWLRAADLQRMQIYLCHYSLLFPHQVLDKVVYYKNRRGNRIDTWGESVYLRLEKPFRVHNVHQHIGWLERFSGDHPQAIRNMMGDIQNQKIKVVRRNCADVENLLAKHHYKIATALLRLCARIMAVQPFYFFYQAYASIRFRFNRQLRVIRDHLSKNLTLG